MSDHTNESHIYDDFRSVKEKSPRSSAVKIDGILLELGFVGIIYASDENIIIYERKNNEEGLDSDIAFEVKPTYNKEINIDEFRGFKSKWSSVVQIDTLNLEKNQRHKIKCQLASAMYSALSSPKKLSDPSIHTLNDINNQINELNSSELKKTKLLYAIIACVVIIIVSLIASHCLPDSHTHHILLAAIIGGPIGVILSTTTGGQIVNSRFDINTKKSTAIVMGMIGVLVGICGAAVAAMTFDIGLIGKGLFQTQNGDSSPITLEAMILMGTVGGFSERFVKGILERITSETDKKITPP